MVKLIIGIELVSRKMEALKFFNKSSFKRPFRSKPKSLLQLIQITIFSFLMLSTYNLGGEEQEQVMDPNQTQLFFHSIFGPTPPGYIIIWTKDDQETLCIPGKEIDKLPSITTRLAKSKEVYFAVGLQESSLGKRNRGTAQSVCGIGTQWMDIDFSHGCHKKENLPASLEEALAFIDGLPLKPSIIVNSGHGLHVYWLLSQLWKFEDDQDRKLAQALSRDFQKLIIQRAQEYGWSLDYTGDLARILRVPGTVNRKTNAVSVTIIKLESTIRYSLHEIREFINAEKSTLPTSKSNIPSEKQSSDELPLAEYDLIEKGCTWMMHCREDAEDLKEPEWYAAASIWIRCKNGSQIAHQLSSPHPKYSHEETEAKVQQALDNAGPRTCENIEEITGGKFCKECIHRGEIQSPITLGMAKDQSASKNDEIAKWIDKLNEKHAVIMIGGKCQILNEGIDPISKGKGISFSRPIDFKNRYLNRQIKIEKRFYSIGEIWLKHSRRRQYEGVIFTPNYQSPTFYNLWLGFPFVPKPGKCDLYLEHIFENIANRNEEIYEYTISWMADAVQHPDKLNGVAIVLRGKQGTGKGIMCTQLGMLFGDHFLHIQRDRHLVGHFNAHLRGVILVYADEAFWAGDKSCEGALKAMITEDKLPIELKGQDVISVKNYIHLLIASNHDWVVPAGMDDRRFFVLDVGEAHRNDHTYFSAIVKQMENGGREALLDYLLKYDLSKINLRLFPKTQGHWENKFHTMQPAEQFVYERLMEGKLLPESDYWNQVIERKDLHDQYIMYAEKIGQSRRSSETVLGITLKKLIPKIKADAKNLAGKRRSIYVFPSLAECRKAFDQATDFDHPWPKEEKEPLPPEDLPF